MNKTTSLTNIIAALTVSLILFFVGSCKKDKVVTVPVLSTTNASAITETSAISGGLISSDGGAAITSRGVCWGTNANPDTTGGKTFDGTEIGSFTSSITGLNPGTIYHVRAYATNSAGTGYGNGLTFTTLTTLASLTTASISARTSNSACSGGHISSDGGASVTARGICWSTTLNPTLSDSKTIDGTGKGTFISSITGLDPGTTYHVRAYATNLKGTAYGNDVTFTSDAIVPVFARTLIVIAVTSTTATSGGVVSSDGGSPITVHGVCWSTSHTPTTASSKTSDPVTGLNFTSTITGLLPGNKYYVRAYATNSVGTAYGNEIEYTIPPEAPWLTTGAVDTVTSASALAHGTITYNGGAPVTDRGVCWNTTGNPTTADSRNSLGAGAVTFKSLMTGLASKTTYYVRAYATNGLGTGYGNAVSFSTLEAAGTLTDEDGNIYQTLAIGTQIWMKENLKTTKLNDGTPIPVIVNNTWSTITTPGMGWYNNDAENYKNKFGGYYNWYAINTGMLCPAGWRVPNDADWTRLFNFLGGITLAGGKLKEAGTTDWLAPNTGATNESGFTGVPGGYRFPGNGSSFGGINQSAIWWTTSQQDQSMGFYKQLQYDTPAVSQGGNIKNWGRNVRCLKQ